MNIRHQLHGEAKNLPSYFDNQLRRFDEADRHYAVLVEYKHGFNGGPKQVSGYFFHGLATARVFKKAQEKDSEVFEVYLLEWDLGINLLEKSSHRVAYESFLDQMEKSLKG